MEGQARDPGQGHRSFSSWCPQAQGTNPSSHSGSTAWGIGTNRAVFSLPKSASPHPGHGLWVQNPKWAGCKLRGAEEPRNGLQPLCPCQAKLHAPTLQKSQQSPVPTATGPPGPPQTTPGGFCYPHGDAAAPTSIRTPPQKGGLAGPAAGLQEVPGAYIRWLRATHPSTTGRGPNPCVPPSVTALLALPEAASSGSTFPILFPTQQSLGEAPKFFFGLDPKSCLPPGRKRRF